MRRIFAIIAAGMILAPAAHAVPITKDSVGESFTVSWLLPDGAYDDNDHLNDTGVDISATALFTVDNFDFEEEFLKLTIFADNTTPSNDHEIGLWKIGFGTDPDTINVEFIDDDDDGFVTASADAFSAFPDSTVIDVTGTTGPGAQSTLQAGETDEFMLKVFFEDLTESATIQIDPFNAFFQGDPDSYQFGSVVGDTPEVPVPGTLALLGTGLIGLGALARRRRR